MKRIPLTMPNGERSEISVDRRGAGVDLTFFRTGISSFTVLLPINIARDLLECLAREIAGEADED